MNADRGPKLESLRNLANALYFYCGGCMGALLVDVWVGILGHGALSDSGYSTLTLWLILPLVAGTYLLYFLAKYIERMLVRMTEELDSDG